MLIKQETIKAEIMWTLKVLMSNHSFRSCEEKSSLFTAMFPDSEITRHFSLGRNKVSYNLTYGLAPYVRTLLLDDLKETKFYSLSFDESYNKIMKKGQMDLIIGYWDSKTGRVVAPYFDSSFLGKSATKDMYDNFMKCTEGLDQTKFLQISSDGPNINLAFLNIINNHRTSHHTQWFSSW